MRDWKVVFALAAFVSLCFVVPVQAGEQVPFKGYFDPVVVAAEPVDDSHVLLTVAVTARTTVLGPSEGTATILLDLASMSYVGTVELIARNGDSLFLYFGAQLLPTSTPGLFDNVEWFEIVGGTGRFEGATGEGIAGGQFNIITRTAPYPIPIVGTVSSPGASRKP